MGGVLTDLVRWVIEVVQSLEYVGVFVLILAGSLYLPVPTELTLPLFGFLVGHGRLSFVPVVLSATAARVSASLILYAAGLKRMPLRWQFLGYTVLGCTIWNTSLISLGWALGGRWRIVEVFTSFVGFSVMAVLIVAILWLFWRRRKAHR